MSSVDSLPTLHARLVELIDAKIERKAALVAEVEAIDRELKEAKALLERWQSPAVPAAATPAPPPAPLELVKPAEAKRPIRMPLHAARALLSDGTPRTPREILTHFGITDGRVAVVFKMWARFGHVKFDAEGRIVLAGKPDDVQVPA